MEDVVLVDTNDQVVGQMEKVQAHRCGVLHRAVSVCLFDEQGRWLLQQRALTKYHSPGKWSNSCCSHPRLGETSEEAACRRLFEELGVTCPLVVGTSFVYRSDVGGGMVEHEFDHLFIGRYTGSFACNSDEVERTEWWTADEIRAMLLDSPSLFTAWFPFIFEHAARCIAQ
jgi:isopentenyl-diphosphate delta-isomerase